MREAWPDGRFNITTTARVPNGRVVSVLVGTWPFNLTDRQDCQKQCHNLHNGDHLRPHPLLWKVLTRVKQKYNSHDEASVAGSAGQTPPWWPSPLCQPMSSSYSWERPASSVWPQHCGYRPDVQSPSQEVPGMGQCSHLSERVTVV